MFDVGTTVRTTVHSIGGRSVEVSGTVYEVKHSRKDGRVVCLYVDTEAHGKLAVSVADARRACVGCFDYVRQDVPTDHARGCPTGQNGTPNYN